MKKTKFVSIVTAMVMSICMVLGTFSASSAEAETKLYTLEELFAMSDEEFLAITEKAYGLTTEYCFSLTEDVSEEYGYTLEFAADLIKEKEKFEYIPNVTENEISKLIGDTIEYNTSNVVMIAHEPYYMDMFCFYMYDEYELMADKSQKDINMMLAKVMYCIRQIIPVSNLEALVPRGDNYNEPVITGDVNGDDVCDLYDAIAMAETLMK